MAMRFIAGFAERFSKVGGICSRNRKELGKSGKREAPDRGAPHPACGHLLPIRCGEGKAGKREAALVVYGSPSPRPLSPREREGRPHWLFTARPHPSPAPPREREGMPHWLFTARPHPGPAPPGRGRRGGWDKGGPCEWFVTSFSKSGGGRFGQWGRARARCGGGFAAVFHGFFVAIFFWKYFCG